MEIVDYTYKFLFESSFTVLFNLFFKWISFSIRM